jgi:hypothetical protein
MVRAGPALELLLRRIAEADHVRSLAEPKLGPHGFVHVDAVVADLFEYASLKVDLSQLHTFSSQQAHARRKSLQIVLLLCWLLAEPSLRRFIDKPEKLLALLTEVPEELAHYTSLEQIIGHEERREEFARLCLSRLELFPLGEHPGQAADRLTSLSSAERQRLVKAAKASELRARELREAAARKAAEEAADKMGRE